MPRGLHQKLSKKRCAMRLLEPTPPERLPIGRSGVLSALTTTSTLSSEISLIPSLTCKSLRRVTETEEYHQVENPSDLKGFLPPSFPCHRNPRGRGPRIPEKRRAERLIIVLNHSCGRLKRTTLHPSVPSPCRSPWLFRICSLPTEPTLNGRYYF